MPEQWLDWLRDLSDVSCGKPWPNDGTRQNFCKMGILLKSKSSIFQSDFRFKMGIFASRPLFEF